MPVLIKYALSVTACGVASVPLLKAEIIAAGLPVPLAVVPMPFGPAPTVTVKFTDDLSEAQRTTLAAVVAAHTAGLVPLTVAKEKKLVEIKAKTAALVAAGSFAYEGKPFGMSEVSQLNITGAFNSRVAPGFAYPVVFFTKNDLDSVSLADATAVEDFHAAAVAAIRTIRDGGAALKTLVGAAATVAEVNAITDNR